MARKEPAADAGARGGHGHEAGPRPPAPPGGRRVVVATDLDRTFTDLGLRCVPACIERAKWLRQAGVLLVLVTGRPAAELPPELDGCFDALVLEGGGVWGRPALGPEGDQAWHVAPGIATLGEVARRLRAHGLDVRQASASLSAEPGAAALLAALQGDGFAIAAHPNVDRIDVTAAGVDKGTGLEAALAVLGVPRRAAWVLAIGDSPNDLPLFGVADASVAVANAAPALAARATAVAPHAAAPGWLWAVSSLVP